MQFVKLDTKILQRLSQQGYNILRSVNTVDDENPSWIPEKVDDVFGYILEMDSESALIVITDALLNIDPDDLKGVVLLD
jgi:hypothetical protein